MTDATPLYQTLPAGKLTFGRHPRALRTLFLTEMWERFSYYGMRALLMLYMVAPAASGGLGFRVIEAAGIYGWYTSLVYLTSLPGGYLADTFLGQRRSVVCGGVVIALGHFCLVFPSLAFFYSGLALIVLGTGLLKPNVSTLVGGLYAPGDARRDGGFSIFYMGINIGAMIAPLACGYLAQSRSFLDFLARRGLDPHLGWHFGFAAAGLGMTFGVAQFLAGLRDFGEVGARPTNALRRSRERAPASISRPAAKPAPLTRDDWTRLGAIVILFLFATLFWAAYEQAGSSLNLFADNATDCRVFGWSFPSTWFQAVNSIFIIALAPVFAWLWVKLGKREPSSPAKFALGLFFVAVSFFVVAGGAQLAHATGGLVSPIWLVLVYFFSTLGELCLSPVGLSTVTKLAPARFGSLMMGVWFLSLAAGNKLGGFIAGHYPSLEPGAKALPDGELFRALGLPRAWVGALPGGQLPALFFAVAVFALAATVLLALLIRPIRKLMAGVH